MRSTGESSKENTFEEGRALGHHLLSRGEKPEKPSEDMVICAEVLEGLYSDV